MSAGRGGAGWLTDTPVCGDALGLRQAEVHVTARIREFVVDTFLLGDDDGFDDDDSLIDGGIVDSTGVMELVSFLEATYGIAIEDRELVAANLDSITRLRAFVDGKVAAAAPAGAAPEAEDAAV